MKNSAIQLSIPEPCHEKWSEMTPKEQGRFCKSCEKILVDFTVMSDQDLINYFQTYNGKLCSRFRKDQMDRSIKPLPSLSFSRNYAASGLLAAGLLLGGTAEAQINPIKGKIAVEQDIDSECEISILVDNDVDECNLSVLVNEEEIVIENSTIIIKGKILEQYSNTPIIGANICIENTSIGTVSDVNGNYELEVPKDLQDQIIRVRVSYFGYEDIINEINLADYNNEDLNIIMEMYEPVIMGMIICHEPEPAPKQSTISKMKNWFAEKKHDRKAKKAARKHEKEAKKAIEIIEEINPSKETTIAKPKVVQKVYPNPAQDFIDIDFETEESQEVLIQLVNITGQVLFSSNYIIRDGFDSFSINLPKEKFLTSNIYFLQISNKKGIIETHQVFISQQP